jgi:hypothetical protein
MPDLTIPEAAAALGVHLETMRRRIRRGELLARRNGSGRYVVSLPDEDTTPAYAAPVQADDSVRTQETTDTTPLVAELRSRIEGLETDKRHLQEALERSQQGEAELRRLLAAEQQKQLPTPMDVTAMPAAEAAVRAFEATESRLDAEQFQVVDERLAALTNTVIDLEARLDQPAMPPAQSDTVPASAPVAAEPAAIEKTLKQAGVKGKKVRRRVAEAFAVLFGR